MTRYPSTWFVLISGISTKARQLLELANDRIITSCPQFHSQEKLHILLGEKKQFCSFFCFQILSLPVCFSLSYTYLKKGQACQIPSSFQRSQNNARTNFGLGGYMKQPLEACLIVTYFSSPEYFQSGIPEHGTVK